MMRPGTVKRVEQTIIELAAQNVAKRFPKLCDALDIQYYPKPPTYDQFEELIRKMVGKCESKKVLERAYIIYLDGVA
jgi:hypothetical protein